MSEELSKKIKGLKMKQMIERTLWIIGSAIACFVLGTYPPLMTIVLVILPCIGWIYAYVDSDKSKYHHIFLDPFKIISFKVASLYVILCLVLWLNFNRHEPADLGFFSWVKQTVFQNQLLPLLAFNLLLFIAQYASLRGVERIAQVSARFALDAMPGKQMTIDSDLNSGHISHEESEHRREKLFVAASILASADGLTALALIDTKVYFIAYVALLVLQGIYTWYTFTNSTFLTIQNALFPIALVFLFVNIASFILYLLVLYYLTHYCKLEDF